MMFKMRQLLLRKYKRELSEYKASGMIQDHLSLFYQASDTEKHPRNSKDFTLSVYPTKEKWTEISLI